MKITMILGLLLTASMSLSAQDIPQITAEEDFLLKLHRTHIRIAQLTEELREARNVIAEKELTIERILITPKRDGWTFDWTLQTFVKKASPAK